MMNNEALELFWYWIRERESIRRLKESGAWKPWSKDQILNSYHFCNVRREDDRVTKEIRVLALKYYDTDQLPAFYTMARMFNHAPSIEMIVTKGWEALKRYRAEGNKIFHTAYVVSTCGKSMDKIDYVRSVVDEVGGIAVPRRALSDAHRALMTVDGLGSFMAGQVVADLRNDRYLTEAWDINWCCPGPGSIKGLGYIFGRSSAQLFDEQITELYAEMPVDLLKMDIHAQDLQNCLCEFSKYWRIKNDLCGRRRYYYDSIRGE